MATGTEAAGQARRSDVDTERPPARSTADRAEAADTTEGSVDAAELFVAITGTSTIRSTQRTDTHESTPDPRERRDYKRQHDALARHEALRDAIEQPDVGA